MANIRPAFVVETSEGKMYFSTKTEATEYMRKPAIMEALNNLTEANEELTGWLYSNQESILSAFDSTAIKRVTKKERKELSDALDAIKESGVKAFDFIAKNAEVIKQVFRWPTVARLTSEEADAYKRVKAAEIEGSSEELGNWLIDNEAKIREAYKAGTEKRKVSLSAQRGLMAYLEKKAELDAKLKELGDDEEAKAALKAKFKEDRAAERAAREEAKKNAQ